MGNYWWNHPGKSPDQSVVTISVQRTNSELMGAESTPDQSSLFPSPSDSDRHDDDHDRRLNVGAMEQTVPITNLGGYISLYCC